MLPKAVSEVWRIVNDLWLLNVKLMNSKRIGSAKKCEEDGLPDNARDSSAAGEKTGI